MAETTMILDINGGECRDIHAFSYTTDVRQLGDPFSVDIPDPSGRWSRKIPKGAKVRLYLQHPEVNNGKKTLKLTGRIRQVEQVCEKDQGRVLKLTGADLGYHLMRSCGPLWFNLERTTYQKLMAAVIDPSWGFTMPPRLERDSHRGLVLGRAQKLLYETPNGLVPLQYIGIEPGETVGDVLTMIARFAGLLVDVSADGRLIAWSPHYDQPPLYRFCFYGDGDPRNNVESVSVFSDSDPLYTHVTCVGEVLMQDVTPPPDDPHPGKKRGYYEDESLLPFRQSLTFVDQEQLNEHSAQRAARWRSDQGQYDAWAYRVRVNGHHQAGTWFEADTMACVNDFVNVDDKDPKNPKRIEGFLWISAVNSVWDIRSGGRSTLTMKRPGLLRPPPITPPTPKKKSPPTPPTTVQA